MRVLVAGGAGYIGSAVTEELLRQSHEVIVLDDMSRGHRAAVHPGAALARCDVRDAEAVERAFAAHPGVEAVLHFAGLRGSAESMRRPAPFLRDSVVAGVNLMDAAARHGAGRFVLASSVDVYGSPARVPVAEEAPVAPRSPYGEGLATLERALGWYERSAGLRYAVLRCFTVAGATERTGEDRAGETHLIPRLLQVALGRRERAVIFGDDHPTPDGTRVRDYVHVADVARAAALALPALAGRSRLCNLGAGVGHSDREVVEAVRRATGRPIPVDVEPRRAHEPSALVAASERARAELGWEPRSSELARIVESAWAWRLAHPDGYGA